MASMEAVNILDVCQVTSPPNSDNGDELAHELSLRLTFLDMIWFKLPSVERIFFYELAELTPSFFHSVVLPKLKQSLSLALLHFLPLTGRVSWPPHAAKPIILYGPTDGVSLTIAESKADFHHLSGKGVRQAIDYHPYIPQLAISESTASTIALLVTLFPSQGFCVGITSHHFILDGRSSTMFLKAWAHLSKQLVQEVQQPSLPPELTPSFDRTVIQDPEGLDAVYLNNWLEFKIPGSESNSRSLKLLPAQTPPDSVRSTFEFSPQDIKKLKERLLSQGKFTQLSTFVVTAAYSVVCLVKAKGLESSRKVYFLFSVDCRGRIGDPPVPENYFGNCVHFFEVLTEADFLKEQNGVAFFSERLSEVIIQGLEKGVLDGAKDKLARFMRTSQALGGSVAVAGSTRFGVYGVDFGWGRPKKVEIASIDKTGAISMAESRDGSGGVEIGLVLKKHEMKIFDSLFVNGLKGLYY